MSYAAVHGQRIWFQDTGGTAAPIVLGHGFLMDHSMFDHQVEALRETYRVITWDSRGFGRTEWDGQPFTYWDLADDCIALLDHLGLTEAVVGGMSQGGFVALRAALRYPDRVRALILMSTQADSEDAAHVELYEAMMAAWVKDGPSDDLAHAVAQIIISDPVEMLRWIPKWQARSRGLLFEAGRCLLTREDLTEQVKTITCPSMIIHGLQDAAIPLERAQQLRVLLPGFQQMTIIDGAGHAPNLTHPDVSNRAIREFLATLP